MDAVGIFCHHHRLLAYLVGDAYRPHGGGNRLYARRHLAEEDYGMIPRRPVQRAFSGLVGLPPEPEAVINRITDNTRLKNNALICGYL